MREFVGTINSSHVLESHAHTFSAEASELGLPIGQWPAYLETTLGNKLCLVRESKKVDQEGDILYVRYRQQLGCISLIIFND